MGTCYGATAMSRRGLRVALLPWSSALVCACLWGIATCGGELPGPQVCGGPEPCSSAEACLLGRCRPVAKAPVSVEAERLVLAPVALARLSAREPVSRAAESDTLVLGDPAEGESLLLLRFALQLPATARIEAAVLRLDPMPACGVMPASVELELSHVLSPWRPETVSWTRRPALGLPMRTAPIVAAPPKPFRLDVTELVREWRDHPERFHGLGLLASGSGPGSACFASGLRSADGPRLELYLAPTLDAGADAGDAGRPDAADAAHDGAEDEPDGEADYVAAGGGGTL
jgi:hypothetical protein